MKLTTDVDDISIQTILDHICASFPEAVIQTTEIGIHSGETSRMIHGYLKDKGRINFHTGIDNQKDFKMGAPFPECKFIIGNSAEVYNQLRDNSQHLVFVDANHNKPSTMVDFLVYSDKVVKGGYMAFHDTGKQIPLMKDYQGVGSKDDPDMYISCRKALMKLGLIQGVFYGWKMVLDVEDPKIETGGIAVFEKLI